MQYRLNCTTSLRHLPSLVNREALGCAQSISGSEAGRSTATFGSIQILQPGYQAKGVYTA